MAGWLLYILRCRDSSLYTGITNDLEGRLQAHKEGKGSKYVRSRLPFRVVYQQRFKNRSNASKREAEIKALSREEKLELVKAYRKKQR